MQGRIEVVETGFVLATDTIWARTRQDRSRGLLGRELQPGEALVLEPARQVHTFGMGYPIDVVFCDSDWLIAHVIREMMPRRVTKIVFQARRAIELPAGTVPRELSVGMALRADVH